MPRFHIAPRSLALLAFCMASPFGHAFFHIGGKQMARPFPVHPYMSKGFEPIGMECDYANLIVDGEVPADLNGSFYRIGPNPQFAPRGNYNPLNGDGMVHAFHVRDGRVSYRNRWVRTEQWTRE